MVSINFLYISLTICGYTTCHFIFQRSSHKSGCVKTKNKGINERAVRTHKPGVRHSTVQVGLWVNYIANL